jgi:hypothetical protein
VAITQQEMVEALSERQQAQKVLDAWSGVKTSYSSWKNRIRDVDRFYSNVWDVVWPDNSQSQGLPRIPNILALAADDRARLVAAGNPSVLKRPSKSGDKAKKAAEKIERILAGYWGKNRVRGYIPRYALDSMFSGLCAVKVMPDLRTFTESRSRADVYPDYCRIDPRGLYPDPIFSEGPTLDNALIVTEQKVRTVEERYNASLSMMLKDPNTNAEMVRVIEFYDDDQIAIIAQSMTKASGYKTPTSWEWLVEPTKHRLFACPIVIGTRPTADGVYRGDFDSVLAVLNTMNRMVTLELDAAITRVYPMMTYTAGVTDPNQFGPDAAVALETPQDKVEYVVPPGAPYSNFQLISKMEDWGRVGSILPAARSGDPSQSIISAAGVGAVNGQESDAVRSLQRDTIGPMLEVANELALCCDEKWGDQAKDISGYVRGQAFTETYTPSKDIAGDYRNQVTYGIYGGLDEINQNVMLLQNAGKLISERSAREQSPLVEDPLREEKQIVVENLDKSILAGIYAGAQAPPGTPGAIDPFTVARLRKLLANEGKSLDEAMEELGASQIPLAQPVPTPVPSGVPGIAGAAAQQAPPGPPLDQLLGGPRP